MRALTSFTGNGIFYQAGLSLLARESKAVMDHFFNAQGYGFRTAHGYSLLSCRAAGYTGVMMLCNAAAIMQLRVQINASVFDGRACHVKHAIYR